MLRVLVLLLLVLSAPARADVSDVARVSLLPGWRDAPGMHMAGLAISLEPGWKTYWRAPGDAGIPPTFDWTGSTNLAGVRVAWPVPHVFDQNGMRSVGYGGGVVLPLVVTPRDPARAVELRGTVELGVCRDICIPVTVALSSSLSPTPVRPDARIRAALADQPRSGAAAGAGPLTCRISPARDGAEIAAELLIPSMGGEEHAVIELADPRVWVSEPALARDGDSLRLRARVHVPAGHALALDRNSLRLTVLGRRGAVEIVGCD